MNVAVTTRARARDFIIKRPRLTKLLDESTSRLLLLVAPAGYGKTTLAREWIAEREHVAWYAGGPAMADVAALSVGVVEVLARLHAPPKEDVVERVRILAARGHDPRGLAKAVAGAAPGSEALLVVDDYQYIAESADAEAFIEELVALTGFRLLLTSRERPAWLAARRVVYGEATVIEMDALAFTDDEARAVLGERKAGRDQILAEARGWPAVIGLAAMRSTGSEANLVEVRDLFDFFAEDLLRSASAPLREALFKLALSGDESAASADALLGSRAKELRAEASERGFVTSVDDRTLHPLLRTFLIEQLRDLGTDYVRTIVSQVVDVFSASRSWDGCLSALEQFPDDVLVVSTLRDAIADLVDSGRGTTLRRWLRLGRTCNLRDPHLLLAEALNALLERDEARAQVIGEQAGRLLDGDSAGRAHLVAARAAHLRDDLNAVRRNCELVAAGQANAGIKADALWVAFSRAREHSPTEAQVIFNRLRDLNSRDGTHAFRLLVAEALMLCDSGQIAAAADQVALAETILASVVDPFARTNFLNLAAHVALLLTQYPEALILAKRQIDEGRSSGLEFAVDHAMVCELRAYIGLRRLSEASRVINALERRSNSSHVLDNLNLQNAKLQIALGDLRRAALLLQRNLSSTERPAFRDELLACQALVSAALGDPVEEDAAKGDPAMVASPEAAAMLRLTQAIIELRLCDNRDRARSLMRRVIDDGQLESVVTACRAFPILAIANRDDSDLSHALAAIFARSRDVDIARRAGLRVPREHRPKREALSAREREVYELLVHGRANREIAEALFISESTAKVHVHHIFEKLGVHTRAEAARLAGLDSQG